MQEDLEGSGWLKTGPFKFFVTEVRKKEKGEEKAGIGGRLSPLLLLLFLLLHILFLHSPPPPRKMQAQSYELAVQHISPLREDAGLLCRNCSFQIPLSQ